MQNYFDREIKQLEKELLRLKTSQQKFAGAIPTIEKSVQLNIPLRLTSMNYASGDAYVKLKSDKTTLFYPSLSKYYDDISLTPSTWYLTRQCSILSYYINGEIYLHIYAVGTNHGQNNDVEVLENGGSVTVTNKLTVIGIDNFTLEVV